MPDLEDDSNAFPNDGIFSGAYDDEDVGAEANFNNMDNIIDVIPIPALRVHKDYPKGQMLGDPKSAVQTKGKIQKASSVQQDLFKLQKVWILVDLPFRKKAIGIKWFFKNKRDERSIVVKNKARLVAQGFRQEEGIEYDEVFAPVARIKAIRLFLAFALFMGFLVYQMDEAFLYGIIVEEVYVHQPPGFVDPAHLNKVYKVIKALYGLHQAPRAWYETLSSFLLENSFRRGTIDKTLFIKKNKSDIMLVQVYVHDIIFGSTTQSMCTEFEDCMHKRFQMSSIADILKKIDFCSIKIATTPIESNKPLVKDKDGIDVDVHVYRFMIGSLMYLTASRLDIMFVVCACARFQVTPKASHLNAVKRIFRYLKHKPKLGLWYPRDSPFELKAFSDSDYRGASLDKKSTTCDCQFLGRRLISWQCKKQMIVVNSTTEAEYVAAANCCGQVLWIQNQMMDYGFNFMNTKIHIDNKSTICIVKNHVYHSRTKHIEIRHHFIRECYEKRLIDVIKIHTDANVADLLTKLELILIRTSMNLRMDGSCAGSLFHIWSKPTESVGFTEIVDFLKGTSLRYALTHNPTIYDSLVKQFWQTATIRTLANGIQELVASVDNKEYTITEASIRSQLQLADATGIINLSDAEIYEGLATLGYVSEGKLTFWKKHFTPQWKFLIHTILHCISPKSGGWDQFGSTIATALICLSSNRVYNFSKLIFDGMVHNLESNTKFLMGYVGEHVPLLPAMLAGVAEDQGEGSAIPAEPHHTPIDPIPSTSQPSIPSTTEPPHSSPPSVGVETEGAATTTSGLDAGMDSGNIHESPLRSHEAPLPEGNTSGSAEDSLQLKELMAIVPKMVTKIDSLEKELKETKQTLGHAVLTLVKKVKSLEVALKRMSKRVILSDSEDEETENQGRKIQDIDDDPLVSLVRESMKEKEADFASHIKASALGEAQEEDISPIILEAVQILSQVVSQSVSTYKRRTRSANKGKDIGISMHFFSATKERLNSAKVEVNTKVNPGSAGVNTVKSQREGKAPMTLEDVQATQKTKEQIRQEEVGLEEAMRLQALQDEEDARQVHLDALLAKRIQEEQELSEQQQKRKAEKEFSAAMGTVEQESSKKQNIAVEDVPVTEEKVEVVKKEEPIKRTRKKKKQKSRKGIHADKIAKHEAEEDMESLVKGNDTYSSSGTDILVKSMVWVSGSCNRVEKDCLSVGLATTQQMVISSPCLTDIKNWLVQSKRLWGGLLGIKYSTHNSVSNTVSSVKTNETQTVKTQVDKIVQISQKEGIGFKKIKACFV
ncbi:putative ribonuclease H-like domain-containing protein, partial [Tanacetum coccineum]